MEPKRFMTLQRHILEGEKKHPHATGELSALLSDLALAAKVISLEVNKAGLIDILGFTGDTNVQGEAVKKLDIFAHNTIVSAMDHGGHLCLMASEEEEDRRRKIEERIQRLESFAGMALHVASELRKSYHVQENDKNDN